MARTAGLQREAQDGSGRDDASQVNHMRDGAAMDSSLLHSMAHDTAGRALRGFQRTLSPERMERPALNPMDIYQQAKPQQEAAARESANMPAGDAVQAVPEVVDIIAQDQMLLDALREGSLETRRHAAEVVRLRCKDKIPFRLVFAQAGMDALVELLWCTDEKTVEHMVTALHNVVLNEELQEGLLSESVITALTHVLETGSTAAKANTAATLFNFARKLKNTEKLVEYPRLYKPLVRLLDGEDLRGRKDAAYAICYLTLVTKGRREFVAAGIVQVLVDILETGVDGLEDKVVAIIGNLAKSSEGRAALVAGDAIVHLAEVLESGSTARAKEDSASALLLLANHDDEALTLIAEEGLLLSLQQVSRSEQISARGQAKAKALLELLRRQQVEGNLQSVKSGSSGDSFL